MKLQKITKLESYTSWIQGGGELFFKVSEINQPIINLIEQEQCDLGNTSEEINA